MRLVVNIVQSLFWFNGILSIHSISNNFQLKSNLGCPEESYSGVTWSSSNQESDDPISSDPMCLDENKFTIYRRCIDQEWSPKTPPNCAYHQKNQEERLPNGFVDVTYSSYAAIYRTAAQPWNNSCVTFYMSPTLAQYYDHLLPSNDFFWLPVRRPRKFYPFVYMNGLSGVYGEIADEFNHLVDAEECLVSNFNGSIIKSANCSDHYQEICIRYTIFSDLYYQYCEIPESTPVFFPTNKCYKVLSEPDDITCDNYFKITSWNEYKILNDLLKYRNKNCRVQIDPFQGQDQFDFEKWQSNVENISFSNWDNDVSNIELSSYVTAGQSGRWNLEETYSCAVCERHVEIKIPQLFLSFNIIFNRLELIIFNFEFRAHNERPICYTTSTGALLSIIPWTDISIISSEIIQFPHAIANNENKFITKTVHLVNVGTDYPGKCWCIVRSFPDYYTRSSNVVVTNLINENSLVPFGLYLNSNFFCNLEYCLNEKPKENLEHSSIALRMKLQDQNPLMNIVDVRAMEMLDLTLDEVEIFFHVTISMDEKLIAETLHLFQFTGNEDIHLTYQMNFIHYVTKELTLSPLYIIPESKLLPLFHCVAEIEDDKGVLRLISARIGEKAIIPKLCLNDDFVLSYWECVGKFPFGARWSSIDERPCETEYIPQHTQELLNIASKFHLTLDDVRRLEDLTSQNTLNPSDLFLVGISLQKFSTTGLDEIKFAHEIQVIPNILSNVLEVSERVAQLGNIYMKASNIILSSYEEIFSYIATNTYLINENSFHESGVIEFNSTNVLTFIIDPSAQNISGVALFRKDDLVSNHATPDLDFSDVDIRYLLANESLSDLIEDSLLESAMIFPEDLLNSIRKSHQPLTEGSAEIPLRIIFSIMKNDVLYQPTVHKHNDEPVGMVLTASIPQYNIEFQSLFLYFLKIGRNLTLEDEFKCGFWKIQSGSGNESEWSDEGCFFIGISHNTTDPVAICGCTHLTSFTLLVTGEDDNLNVESLSHHPKALDVVTITGCSLSLAGIILIWITALVFKSRRNKKGTKVLLHLSLGIALQNVLILIQNFKVTPISGKPSCIVFGVSLHYSVLVVFAWMLIATYFQYLRFVRVFQSYTTRIILKCCVVGWIAPLLPIVVILSINFNLYAPHNFVSDAALCCPQGEAFYYGLILPVSFIIVINLFVFGRIIYNITCGSQKTRTEDRLNQIHMDQLRIIIFLFFLLVFNWICGIFINVDQKSLVLSYLFCITASLQGLPLFVYLILQDLNTRSLWINFRKYVKSERPN